jgi:F-type H+-transporting ATPase subunit epsilon
MLMPFSLITPMGVMLTSDVDAAVIPASNGEIEILPGHRPLMALVVPGELRLRRGEQVDAMVIDRGFLYVSSGRIVVTVEQAISVKEVNIAAVELAQKRAEEALQAAATAREALDPEEVKHLEAKIRYQLAQKMAKSQHKM